MSARPSLQTSADSFEGLKDVAHSVHFDNLRELPSFRDATKSPRNNVRGKPAEILYWWRVITQTWVVLLIGCEANFPRRTSTNQKHYPDLSSDTSSVFLVFVPQIWFGGETSHDVAKYRLFSRATIPGGGTWVYVCWVCAAGLSEPLPHYSLYFWPSRPSLSHFLENVIFAIPT